METTVNANVESQRDRISRGCNLHRFFKNKIYTGIDREPLIRKVYRGKRDTHGKRKNEYLYVNADQTFRIEESLLIDGLNDILDA